VTKRLRLLKVDAVATLLDEHPMTVYRRSREGLIPGRVKIGGAVRFREDAILQWIREAELANALPPETK